MNITDFAWTINAKGEIWTVKPQGGAELIAPENFAAEISVGADATVWVVSREPQPGQSGNIIKWYDVIAKQWHTAPAPAAAVKVADTPDGVAWTVNTKGEVWRISPQGGAELMAPENFATEISVGVDGTAWVISPDPQPGQSGNIIKWYDVVGKQWQTVPAPAAAVKAAMNHDLTPPPTLSNTEEAWVNLPQRATFQSFWDSTNRYDPTQSTHLWIVCRAAEVARSQQPYGQKIYDLVKPAAQRGQDAFHDGICEGLWDADEVDPYRNSVVEGDTWYGKLSATYKSHFYDPTTSKNWLGETSPTALTEGPKFFGLALSEYAKGDMRKAGYNLGLSLHYLTDMTQPMHSHNFTVLSSDPIGYHSAFESYAIKVMNEVAITQGYVASNLSSDPGEYIKAAARTSRQRFDAICSLSNLWSWKYPLFAVLSPWEDSVKPQINDGLKEAVAITAQYLVLWMQLAYHPTPTPDDGPHIMEAAFYRLTNAFLGEGRALDTYSNANNQPFMGNTGNYSGQCWKFTSLGNGYYRLTNMFLGEGRALDTYSNGKNDPFMGNTGNYGGQYWKLTQVRWAPCESLWQSCLKKLSHRG